MNATTTNRPPASFEDLGEWAKDKILTGYEGGRIADVDDYKREYRAGRAAANAGSESGPWHNGTSTWAYDDGYLDAAAGREIWHYAYCNDPDQCGEH